MLVNADKFLIMALQEAGYDIDFKKFKEIYTKSRQYPECQYRKLENQRENEMIDHYASMFNEANADAKIKPTVKLAKKKLKT